MSNHLNSMRSTINLRFKCYHARPFSCGWFRGGGPVGRPRAVEARELRYQTFDGYQIRCNCVVSGVPHSLSPRLPSDCDRQMGDANASIPTVQPIISKPMWGAYAASAALNSVSFVSQVSIDSGESRRDVTNLCSFEHVLQARTRRTDY